jgi:hypothetical protein
MTFARKLRLQALFCALAVFACVLISFPFTTMNVCDDGPYIRMAHTFANTGHIVYNGWGAPNYPLIKVPTGAYVIQPPPPPGYCRAFWYDRTPHVHPVYGISLLPDFCYGRAPFAPVLYRPWPFRTPVNVYAVRYAPPAN